MRSRGCALVVLALMAASCGSGSDGAHVGYWMQDRSSCQWPGCREVNYLMLDSGGKVFIYHRNLICDEPTERVIWMGTTYQYAYSVDGTTLRVGSSDDPSIFTLVCDGDTMTINANSAIGGNWTRASGDDLSALESLFGLKCPAAFDHCFASPFAWEPCTADEDCRHSKCDESQSICAWPHNC